MVPFLHDQAINSFALMTHVEECSLKGKSQDSAYIAFHLLNKDEFLLILEL